MHRWHNDDTRGVGNCQVSLTYKECLVDMLRTEKGSPDCHCCAGHGRRSSRSGAVMRVSTGHQRGLTLCVRGNLVEKVHAIMLAGGSAYGLDAACGAMEFLEEQGVGFATGFGVVPIVGAAVIFDLDIGNPKARPDSQMGYLACKNASSSPPEEGMPEAGPRCNCRQAFRPRACHERRTGDHGLYGLDAQ